MKGYVIFCINDYSKFDKYEVYCKYCYLSFEDFFVWLESNRLGFTYRLFFDIEPTEYDYEDFFIYEVVVTDNGV